LLDRLLGRRAKPGWDADVDAQATDFRAVSIVPTQKSCVAAKRLRLRRYLVREAPQVPLPGCPNRSSCECRYRKFPDRRVDDRRDIVASGRWYTGTERRRSPGRRASDITSRIEMQ
jgi:hypothetical protein